MNTWHKAARNPQFPSTFTLCTNSAHPYQNKGFINQNDELLSPLFSHTSAHLLPYPLCFDMLHKNTRGWVVTSVATVPSRIGMTEKHGRRNPRTGLKTGHYIRRRTARLRRRPLHEQRMAGTMYRDPTQKKAGRANREIHPAEPAGWSRVGVPRGAARAFLRAYTFSSKATK